MTDPAPVMVETTGLTRRFGALTAVDRLTLRIERGEIFGLVGPDGAGKTTTLRLLCGLIHPTEGSVRVVGRDVRRELDAIKDRIGYMAQRFGLYVDLTVEENMRFYADLFGISPAERGPLTARLLKMTRMEPFRDRLAGNLSGGMKQKLALMCTLLHHPEVLFLDEPTNGVDPVSRRDFLGHPLSTGQGRADRGHHDGLPRRSGALQPGRPDAPGEAHSVRGPGCAQASYRGGVLRGSYARCAARPGSIRARIPEWPASNQREPLSTCSWRRR